MTDVCLFWMPGVVSVCHRSPHSSFAKTLWGRWLLQVPIIYLCWTWMGAPASVGVALLLVPQVAAVCGVLPGHSSVSVPKTDGEDLCWTVHPQRGVFWALGEQICCSSLTQIFWPYLFENGSLSLSVTVCLSNVKMETIYCVSMTMSLVDHFIDHSRW